MSVVFPPGQIVEMPEMDAVMEEFTVTTTVSVAFPQAVLTVQT